MGKFGAASAFVDSLAQQLCATRAWVPAPLRPFLPRQAGTGTNTALSGSASRQEAGAYCNEHSQVRQRKSPKSAALAVNCGSGQTATIEQNLSLDLDYRPQLSVQAEILSLLLPAVIACLVYVATAPASFSLKYAASTASGYALMVMAMRTRVVEQAFKARERVHAELGDHDSSFHALESVNVHVKTKVPATLRASASRAAGFPAAAETAAQGSSVAAGLSDRPSAVLACHCYHGFGANLGSYMNVQELMAERLSAVVTAHDMPGFGLTERPKDTASYFLNFNGRLGRLVMDYELTQLGLLPRPAVCGKPLHEAVSGKSSGASEQQPPQVQQKHATAADPAQDAVMAENSSDSSDGGDGSSSSSSSMAMLRSSSSVTSIGGASSGSSSGGSSTWPGAEGVSSPYDAQSPSSASSAELVQGANGSIAAVKSSAAVSGSIASTFMQLSASGASEATLLGADQLRRLGAFALAGEEVASAAGASGVAAAAAAPKVKRVLVGHSMGGACAALEACRDPGRLAGVVLIAPAIIAFPGQEFSAVKLLHRPPAEPYAPAMPSPPPSRSSSDNSRSDGTAVAAALAAEKEPYVGVDSTSHRPTDLPVVQRLYPSGAPSSLAGERAAEEARRRRGATAAAVRALLALLQAAAMLSTLLVLRALSPLITLALRAIVRNRQFWERGLQQAYYDPGQVSSRLVDVYRMPQLVRGWEEGMVTFLLARLAHTRGIKDLAKDTLAKLRASWQAATGGAAKDKAAKDSDIRGDTTTTTTTASEVPPNGALEDVEGDGDDKDLAQRFAAVVRAHRLPVLIVHGRYDRLVPASNSQRLARMLPGCELVLLDKCGHMPQEEMPEVFVDLVQEFAERL